MITYNGNYTIENMTINSPKTNNGNLTIINCQINSLITNNGNLNISNSTFENFSANINRSYSAVCINNKNNATLSLNNTRFINNGNENNDYTQTEENINNALIFNMGVIDYWNNVSFINNTVLCYHSPFYYYQSGAHYPDIFMLTVTDSLFENNSYGAIKTSNLTVVNTEFINNSKRYEWTGYNTR